MVRYGWSVVLLAWTVAAHAQAAAEPRWQEAPLEIVLNSQSAGQVLVVLRESSGDFWLEAGDFRALRLRLPAVTPLTYAGRPYYPLAAIPGLNVQLDETRQRAVLRVPEAAFETSARLIAPNPAPTPAPSAPGAFLNYQLSLQRISSQDNQGVLAQLGVFGRWGVFTDSTAARSAGSSTQAVRLDTTFVHDFPERLETLTVGDTISNPGTWGEAVRFAGLHWGSNFALRPDLITAPLLSIAGAAVVPSTVDVLVNSQRVSSQQLPPGPFVINNVPPLSGAGEVSLVVRDALGREQVVTQSFYSGTSLLASGLSQYSIDLGPIRDDYALRSNAYGGLIGGATYRRGLNDALTLEEHAEFQARDARAGGLNAAVRTGSFGIATLTAAVGGDGSGSGLLWGASFEHHASIVSFTASILRAGAAFRQVGDEGLLAEPFRQKTLMQVGFNLGRSGSLSLADVRETFASQRPEQTSSLSYYLGLPGLGALGLTLSHSASPDASTSAFLTFTRPLQGRDAASLSLQGGSGSSAPRNEAFAMLTRGPPVGPGEGYRLGAGTAGDYDADWHQQFSAGNVEVEAARNGGVTGQSMFGDGALIYIGGAVYASRALPGSFAVIDVGGLADIPVYVENQLVAHTDERGRALLPNLLPYAANRISIDPVELPLDTTIDARSMLVAPASGSGVILRFPVERVRAGIFRLFTERGEPVPAGASVDLDGGSFPVALEGTVYVTGFDHGTDGVARWPGGQCRFRLNPPPHDDPLPDMGTIVCRMTSAAPR
jgi:outer membrane usher protein